MTAVMPAGVETARDLVGPAIATAVDRLSPEVRMVAAYHLGLTDADGRPETRTAGKALRPALAVLSARAAGAAPERGVPAAAAVEFVHNFSLLHDDIMDGDAERRHRPTAWTVFGVGAAILADIRSGELPFQMACTLARVLAAFSVAFSLGVVAGYAMGRWKVVDRYADPWLIVLLNLPALVVIIFAYVWIGLNETAAIVAVALNKLPNVIVVTREGVRSLDASLDDMSRAFRMKWLTRIRHVVLPQLAPYLAAVSRSSLSISWKIVLVVELIGRPNGVGFVLGSAFSLFDMTKILSYAISFVALMLAIETLLVQPLERRTNRWRRRPA